MSHTASSAERSRPLNHPSTRAFGIRVCKVNPLDTLDEKFRHNSRHNSEVKPLVRAMLALDGIEF